MGDYFPGRISIGGTLHLKAPAGKVQEDWEDLIGQFLTHINETSPDFGENLYKITNAENLENFVDEKTKCLICCDDQAKMGEFSDLEELCQELGLSYDRWSDALYEYEAMYSKWRPDFVRPFECQADKGEHEVCDRKPVVEVYEMAYNGANPRTIAEMLRSVLYTVPGFDTDPPELEPFKVVE